MSALLLSAFGVHADGFRWGGSHTGNRVKYSGSYYYLKSDTGRAYLYLGEAKIVNNKLSLEDITYVCDDTAPNTSPRYNSFGNYKVTDPALESELISAEGGQKFSIIVVSLYKPTSVTAGKEIAPGKYYSVSIKTGTSVAATDNNGNKYASLVVSAQFANADCSNEGEFTKSVEPIADGGYMWGDSVYGSCRVPRYDYGTSTGLNGSTARAYLYLGKAEYKNGAVNLGNLTYLTNSIPLASGLIGNYSAAPTAATLIQDDRVDPNGGQDFTIFIVTPDVNNKMPPNPLAEGYAANYIAILTGTSKSAVTSDGAKHAQLVSDKATATSDFLPDKLVQDAVPLIDVGGSTIGIY